MDILSRARLLSVDRTTSGVYIDGRRICYSVEDRTRDRDVDGDGDIDAKDVGVFKVYGKTAIPGGIRYRVTLEMSGKFGPDTITINGVPGFTYIRCHPGADENSSEGCVIPGMELMPDGKIKPGTSTPAVNTLKRLIKDSLDHGEEVWWEFDRSLVQEV